LKKKIAGLLALILTLTVNYAQSEISAIHSINEPLTGTQPDGVYVDTLLISLDSGSKNWLIPDGRAYGVYFSNRNLASQNAIVTKVEYKLRIDDRGDSSDFRCADYVVFLSSKENPGLENDINVYSQLGGDTDGGYDDDEADDSDIYLNWRSTDFFNGEKLNQYWGAKIYDVHNGKSGKWNYLKLKIYYVVKSLGSLYVEVKNIPGYNQSLPGSNGRVQLYDEKGKFVQAASTLSSGEVYFGDIPAADNYSIDVYHYPHDPITIFGVEYWGNLNNINITPDKTTNINFERSQPFKLDIRVFKNGVDVTGGNLNINEELEIRVTIKNPSSKDLTCNSQLALDRNKIAPYDFNKRSKTSRIKANTSEVFNFSFTPEKPGQYFSVVGAWTNTGSQGLTKKITDGDAWYYTPIINAIDPTKEIIPPFNPQPPHRFRNVSVDLSELSWDAATLNGNEVSAYDVYFGDDPTPDNGELREQINTHSWTIDPSLLPLEYNKIYFWRVAAKEGSKKASSEIWSFRTERDPSEVINEIKYDIYIWEPNSVALGSPIRIFSGQINENTTILVPDININSWFGSIAAAFNTISGSSIHFGNIANEDIYVKIKFLFGIGGPRVHAGEKLFMEMWFEVFRLSDLQPYYGDYDFNENEYVAFRLDKDQGLANFANQISLHTDSLAFYYLLDDGFSDEGLETLDEEEFLTFRASHFSKFGGGRGNITSTTKVEPETTDNLPDKFLLLQNYPNPFNPTTTIKYSITVIETQDFASQPMVQLKAYDLLGREIAILVNEYKSPENYEATFDAKHLPSGVYIYRLQTEGKFFSKKMLLLK